MQTESELDDLDVNLTFGAFTWDPYGDEESVPGDAHREIDFEDGRWGDAGDPTNAQFVVQPWNAPDNLHRYTLPDLSGSRSSSPASSPGRPIVSTSSPCAGTTAPRAIRPAM